MDFGVLVVGFNGYQGWVRMFFTCGANFKDLKGIRMLFWQDFIRIGLKGVGFTRKWGLTSCFWSFQMKNFFCQIFGDGG